MEKSTCMDMYEGGDGLITDIHVGRIRVAKLTLMEIYEGGRRRAYLTGDILRLLLRLLPYSAV